MEDKTNVGNVTAESAADNATTATKKTIKSTKAKAKRVKATHPPTSEMVTTAIKELKDRKGSSLQAIKKYIVSTYKADGEKLAPFIKKYLKAAVASGSVVQTKGKGASGSFKLATEKPDTKVKKVQRGAKKVEPKKTPSIEKKSVMKKLATPKKVAASKKVAPKRIAAKAATLKSKAAAESRSMSKAKKAVKAPAAKTRTPKPKKAATMKAVKAPAKK